MAKTLEELERDAFTVGNIEAQHAYADCIALRDMNESLEIQLHRCRRALEKESADLAELRCRYYQEGTPHFINGAVVGAVLIVVCYGLFYFLAGVVP